MQPNLNHLKISVATAADLPQIQALLKSQQNSSLFLLSWLEQKQSQLDNLSTIRDQSGNIRAVFKYYKDVIQLQSDRQEDYSQIIFDQLQKRETPLKGISADWSLAEPIFLKLKDSNPQLKTSMYSKEKLYTLELPVNFQNDQVIGRLLNQNDCNDWCQLRTNYFTEIGLKQVGDLAKIFEENLNKKIIWGYHDSANKLVATTYFNAQTSEMAQIGGVYTLTEYRGQGIARKLVAQQIKDAHELHQLKQLVLFTGEDNLPAQQVYEGLGFKQVGHYGLIFFE